MQDAVHDESSCHRRGPGPMPLYRNVFVDGGMGMGGGRDDCTGTPFCVVSVGWRRMTVVLERRFALLGCGHDGNILERWGWGGGEFGVPVRI